MSDKGITLEGLAAAVDALRQELATWKALAHKQDALTAAQITATQSGATAAKIDQIAVNTAAIQALSAQVAGQISLEYVTTLPATGEPFTLYLVPQGDGTAPNYCNEYLWINGDWELIGTTGSMANNGELVIQVNGVAVGTFTANQAANTAVNITVPTNTNQLVNGAQYVDAAALATALALKQNNLNAAQLDAVNSGITAALVTQIGTNTTAIAGKQDALTTAQQAAVDSGATAAKIGQIATNAAAIVSLTSSKQDTLSTAQLAAVNSGITSAAVQQISTNTGAIATKAADSAVVHLAGAETITGDKTFTGAVVTHNLTPETTGTYSLGSSSYQWSSVYAQTYYYNGTAWGLDKSNVWTGANTFKSQNTNLALQSTTSEIGSLTASSNWLRWIDKNASQNAYISRDVWSDGADILRIAIVGKRANGAPSTSGSEIDCGVRLNITADGTKSFTPFDSNTNLGTSANKWKTLNGINPGNLSIPNISSVVDISGSITSFDGTTIDLSSIITVPGWINIVIPYVAGDYIRFRLGRAGGSTAFNNSRYIICGSSDGDFISVFAPVSTGLVIQTNIKASGGAVTLARFYPCFGNV